MIEFSFIPLRVSVSAMHRVPAVDRRMGVTCKGEG